MTATFGPAYAGTYDAVYAEKDYDRECDLLEETFRAYGGGAVDYVVDLGCGTGNHSLRLASRGYDVTGIDISEEMLGRARAKAGAAEHIRWIQADIATVDPGRTYDAALLMFAVLGYQHSNADLARTLANARRLVRDGGLLIFDVWYGPAVLAQRPEPRSRMVRAGEGEIRRDVSAELDVRRHICSVEYSLRGEGGAPFASERHVMRYFFPMEIEASLDGSGFELLRLGAFEDPEREPDETTWNAIVVARAT